MKYPFPKRHSLALAVVLLGAGCAAHDVVVPVASESVPTPSTVRSEFDPVLAGQIMERPLDGSSVAAFEAGLAQVQAAVSPADYHRLQTALQWLEFYDISSRGDRGRLYRALDGMTPREIIYQAKWRGE
jgi:hypothetical protein